MKLKFRYSLFCIFALLLSSTGGLAQRGYTMNFLSQVPQQSKFNPAYYTCYANYAGIPLLSSVQFQLNNDAFSIGRSIYRKGDTALIDVNRIISNLSSDNNLGFDFGVDIFSLGFKIGKKNQLHLGLGVEGFTNVLLTKSTLSFLFKGPGSILERGASDVLSGNSVDLSVYGAFSVGFAREINEKLSVGMRVKLLSGFANLTTTKSHVNLKIDNGDDPEITPYTYFIQPDVELAGSFANSPQDSNLFYALKHLGSSIRLNSPKDNFGMGFDFGAVYQFNDRVSLGAGVYDIGYINWNTGVKKISSQDHERPFVFSGVGNLNDIVKDKDFDIKNVLTSLTDSVIEYFQINQVDTTFSSYRSKLRTSYNISGFYNFTDDDQLGVMWNAQIGRQKSNSLTIAYTRLLGPNFSVCINNAIINENVFNFGGGFAFNTGPLQFYLVVDKISSLRVINMRAINIQFGLNLVLNRIEKDMNKQRFMKDYTPRDKTGYVKDRWAY